MSDSVLMGQSSDIISLYKIMSPNGNCLVIDKIVSYKHVENRLIKPISH